MNRGTLKEVLAAAKKYSQHLTKEHVAVLRKNGATDESYVQHEYTSDKDMKHMIADLRNKDMLKFYSEASRDRVYGAFYIFQTEDGKETKAFAVNCPDVKRII